MTDRPAWADINTVTLQGRLGRDPESRTTQSGALFVNLNLATSERWKDKRTGEQKEQTQWHRVVVAFNDAAQNVALEARKGTRVKVTGKLIYRKWTGTDGAERVSTEIEVGRFGSVEIVPDDRAPQVEPVKRDGGYPPRPGETMLDDEIPF